MDAFSRPDEALRPLHTYFRLSKFNWLGHSTPLPLPGIGLPHCGHMP